MLTFGEFIRGCLTHYNDKEATWIKSIETTSDGSFLITLVNPNNTEEKLLIEKSKKTSKNS